MHRLVITIFYENEKSTILHESLHYDSTFIRVSKLIVHIDDGITSADSRQRFFTLETEWYRNSVAEGSWSKSQVRFCIIPVPKIERIE